MAWFKFWIKSDRGTDEITYLWIPSNELPRKKEEKKKEIEDRLECWCSRFYAWTASICDYGFKQVGKPPKEFLKKQIKLIKEDIESYGERLDFLETQLKRK